MHRITCLALAALAALAVAQDEYVNPDDRIEIINGISVQNKTTADGKFSGIQIIHFHGDNFRDDEKYVCCFHEFEQAVEKCLENENDFATRLSANELTCEVNPAHEKQHDLFLYVFEEPLEEPNFEGYKEISWDCINLVVCDNNICHEPHFHKPPKGMSDESKRALAIFLVFVGGVVCFLLLIRAGANAPKGTGLYRMNQTFRRALGADHFEALEDEGPHGEEMQKI